MSQKRNDLLLLTALLAVLLLFYSKILFTHQIIRAPDIINEFYWWAKAQANNSFWDIFKIKLFHANWDIINNSGNTDEGGSLTSQFLFNRNLVFTLIPPPANVAWFIVLQLFFGAAGTYCYCRLIGASRVGSFLAGLVFSLAPENASLINAGHVMKIATITYAPWVFYFFEKGFQTRRVFWFLVTAVVLAFQFFNIHWQIAFYTCLGVACYGIMRIVGVALSEKNGARKVVGRLLCLNLVTMFFFLSTVSMSLVPLANWSKATNRGAESGASQGKGGLEREEAMSWSLPPEELAGFVIPGFFGFSRQEAGENPSNIDAYYWGRMNFTQTVSYMGLLPWLLVPLPLIFRRNRYTWIALAAVVGGVVFSMGKYSLIYNFLFDYFPGINRFRVPKMMMFFPVLGLGVLSALGLDLLRDPVVRASRAFRYYLLGVVMLPVSLGLLWVAERVGQNYWISRFLEVLAQPTRYQPSSQQLVLERWNNLMMETALAAGLAALFAVPLVLAGRREWAVKWLPVALILLFLVDVGRVNSKFLFLVDEPQKSMGGKTPDIVFLQSMPKQYRVLPFNGDPGQYASAGIPVMFISNPVQQRRWQEFLDSFNVGSSMPDILNVRYLVESRERYEKEKAAYSAKFSPVFFTPDGNTVILENRTVLPKAWLVPSAALVQSVEQRLGAMQSPLFDPRQIALVESPPPISLAPPGTALAGSAGQVRVLHYEGERIELEASVAMNSMLILGEKYYKGWRATVDGKGTEIYPVNHVLRGIYLTPGQHRIEFVFDPTPFKVGKALTLASFALFAVMLGREVWLGRRERRSAAGRIA